MNRNRIILVVICWLIGASVALFASLTSEQFRVHVVNATGAKKFVFSYSDLENWQAPMPHTASGPGDHWNPDTFPSTISWTYSKKSNIVRWVEGYRSQEHYNTMSAGFEMFLKGGVVSAKLGGDLVTAPGVSDGTSLNYVKYLVLTDYKKMKDNLVVK